MWYEMTRTISLKELQGHTSRNDCWMVIDGKVYDVTKFLQDHPGGEEVLLEVAGTDASEAFDDVGHSDDAIEMMEEYFVGDFEKV